MQQGKQFSPEILRLFNLCLSSFGAIGSGAVFPAALKLVDEVDGESPPSGQYFFLSMRSGNVLAVGSHDFEQYVWERLPHGRVKLLPF